MDDSAQRPAVAVLTSLPWDEAWLLRGRLRADGIDASVSPDDFTAYTYTPRKLFEVVVPEGDLAEARRIAAEFDLPRGEAPP